MPASDSAMIVEPYGDSAVMVSFSEGEAAERRRSIAAFRDRFLTYRPHGVTDVVSGLESLLISYDDLLTSFEHIRYTAQLLMMVQLPAANIRRTPRNFLIPVVFDPDSAPDLPEVAAELGYDEQDVVDRVCGSGLTITLLAAAMAPMMDGLDVPRQVRRRSEPRTDVPAGSIMIAGHNAIIQPFPGPSGWRVIGRTPHTIVDIRREQPVSFAPGDTVRFTPITVDAAAQLDGAFLVEEIAR